MDAMKTEQSVQNICKFLMKDFFLKKVDLLADILHYFEYKKDINPLLKWVSSSKLIHDTSPKSHIKILKLGNLPKNI